MEEFDRLIEIAKLAQDDFAKEGLIAPALPEKLNEIVRSVNEIEKTIPGCKPALLLRKPFAAVLKTRISTPLQPG
jgi:hypothetical protein